jgi:hypothetical protein
MVDGGRVQPGDDQAARRGDVVRGGRRRRSGWLTLRRAACAEPAAGGPARRPAARAIRHAARTGRRAVEDLLIRCANPLARVNREPIFLLGNQKSGTSAICSLLALCTGRSVTVDLRRETGRQFYLRIVHGDVPFRALIDRNRRDFSRDIIKEPNLTLFHRDLRGHFPAAKYVIIVRDPRHNIRSILNRVNVPGNLPRLGASPEYDIDPGFALVLGSGWPGVTPRDHYIEQLAERWNACADVYLASRSDMTLVRYEDFSRDKEGTIHRLAQALGLAPRYDIGDKVDVPFQPGGNRHVSWNVFYGAENLARIERICRSRMELLGYA